MSDVAVVKPAQAGCVRADGGVAVLDCPQSALSPSIRMRVPNEPLRHHFVESGTPRAATRW